MIRLPNRIGGLFRAVVQHGKRGSDYLRSDLSLTKRAMTRRLSAGENIWSDRFGTQARSMDSDIDPYERTIAAGRCSARHLRYASLDWRGLRWRFFKVSSIVLSRMNDEVVI